MVVPHIPRCLKLHIYMTIHVITFIVLGCKYYTVAIRIRGCSSTIPDYLELTESQVHVITCEDIPGTDKTVTWERGIGRPPTYLLVGTCDNNLQCSERNANVASLSRPYYSTSTMTLKNVSRDDYEGGGVRCYTSPSSTETAACNTTVIFPAQMETTCPTEIIKSSSPWMVNVTCSVVRAYTMLYDGYKCIWVYTSSIGISFQIPDNQTQRIPHRTLVPGPSPNYPYYSYNCSIQVDLPDVQGRHSYNVIAYPGLVVGPTTSITIDVPDENPVIGCNVTNGYIAENSSPNCSCTVRDFGQPVGSLRVYRAGSVVVDNAAEGRNVTFTLPRVNRQNDNEILTCALNWIRVMTTNYRLNLAYGPDVISLSDPGPIELNPFNPGRQQVLTCTTTSFKPSVSYLWTGACDSSTTSSCTFTPTASNDGDVIACTAINAVTKVQITSNRVTLKLHYPPTLPPVVTSQVLYSGQPVTINCTVSGGNPPVTSVTFGCGDKKQISLGTIAVISITADSSRDGQRCECSANWENKSPSWYTLTSNVTLTVYYAPTAPTINTTSLFPFLDGESPTLVCSFPTGINRGNPPATLTWQGQQGMSTQNETRLTLTSLKGPLDHNRTVVCEASNAFTVYNRSSVTSMFRLLVYHLSDVLFLPQPNSDCIPTSAPDPYCVVDKGQRVVVQCIAEGNPALASVTWLNATPSSAVLNFTASRNTSVVQVCNVTTGTVSSDTRLPLTELRSLHVYTLYSPQLTRFQINGQSGNVTVNERDRVTVTCTAEARPTPALILVKDGTTLDQRPQGPDYSTAGIATVGYTVAVANCSDAGQYLCSTRSGAVGLFLYVLCSPRLDRNSGSNPIKIIINNNAPVEIPIDIVAYPQLHPFRFFFQGQNKSLLEPVASDRMNIVCNQYNAISFYSCNIFIHYLLPEYVGYYSIYIKNDLGSTTMMYYVTDTVNRPGAAGYKQEGLSSGGVAGIVIAIFALLIAAVIVWMWRRHWVLPCTDAQASVRNQLEHKKSDVQEVYSNTMFDGDNEELRGENASAYADLDVGDMNKRSEYDDLSRYQNSKIR